MIWTPWPVAMWTARQLTSMTRPLALSVSIHSPSISSFRSVVAVATSAAFFSAPGSAQLRMGEFKADDLAAPMLPVLSILHLLTLLGTSKYYLTPIFCVRMLVSASATMAAVTCQSGAALISLMVLVAHRRKPEARLAGLVRLAVMALCAAIQLWVLATTPDHGSLPTPLGASPVLLARMIARQVVFGLEFGMRAMFLSPVRPGWSSDAANSLRHTLRQSIRLPAVDLRQGVGRRLRRVRPTWVGVLSGCRAPGCRWVLPLLPPSSP